MFCGKEIHYTCIWSDWTWFTTDDFMSDEYSILSITIAINNNDKTY